MWNIVVEGFLLQCPDMQIILPAQYRHSSPAAGCITCLPPDTCTFPRPRESFHDFYLP